ncbi:MAG: NAD(P)H-binding protein [Opitutaceae bacterium]
MSSLGTSHKPLVAVSGASGFVGSHLRAQLADAFDFRALSRSPNVVERNAGDDSTHWRQCDLYSLPKLTEALQGCEYGLYLVHSMAPSSRLMQANFEDTDLLLADNFIRAAEEAGLKHVIYLSGLMPELDDQLSPHLRSRYEVEQVLRSRSVSVTVLRAGLIFGSGGSSFSMLINLVRRLPVMLLPAWTGSMTHSIDIDNVCEAFRICLESSEVAGGVYDLGGHAPMTYRDMILKTSELLGGRVRAVDVPLNWFALSKHWVALFSGVAPALVGPLQESLRHNLQAKENVLLERLSGGMVSFEDSFRKAVDEKGMPLPNPRSLTQSADKKDIRKARRVRSVQRMPLPDGWDAKRIAAEYAFWLGRRFHGLINAKIDDAGVVRFQSVGGRLTLLELTPTPFTLTNERRCSFYISGGVLSRNVNPPGRFEFRLFPENGCSIASIHGFMPMLPWWLYVNTQAIVHLRVMHAFARYLKGVPRAELSNNA